MVKYARKNNEVGVAGFPGKTLSGGLQKDQARITNLSDFMIEL
jgi:hypothetical protein